MILSAHTTFTPIPHICLQKFLPGIEYNLFPHAVQIFTIYAIFKAKQSST